MLLKQTLRFKSQKGLWNATWPFNGHLTANQRNPGLQQMKRRSLVRPSENLRAHLPQSWAKFAKCRVMIANMGGNSRLIAFQQQQPQPQTQPQLLADTDTFQPSHWSWTSMRRSCEKEAIRNSNQWESSVKMVLRSMPLAKAGTRALAPPWRSDLGSSSTRSSDSRCSSSVSSKGPVRPIAWLL